MTKRENFEIKTEVFNYIDSLRLSLFPPIFHPFHNQQCRWLIDSQLPRFPIRRRPSTPSAIDDFRSFFIPSRVIATKSVRSRGQYARWPRITSLVLRINGTKARIERPRLIEAVFTRSIRKIFDENFFNGEYKVRWFTGIEREGWMGVGAVR